MCDLDKRKIAVWGFEGVYAIRKAFAVKVKKLRRKMPVDRYECKLFSLTSNDPALNLDCFSLF